MPRRAGSPTPFLIGFLILALVALAGNWRIEMMRREGRRAATSTDNNLRLAEQGVEQLRGAQSGYLVTGQSIDEWLNRATAASVELESGIANLLTTSTTPEAKPHYELATQLVIELVNADKKARAMIAAADPAGLTNVLQQEATEPVRKLTAELMAARDAEFAGFEKAATNLGWLNLAINGVTLALGLLLMMVVARGRGQAQTAGEEAPSEGGLSLGGFAPTLEAKPAAALSAEPSVDPFVAPSSVDLTRAAEVCVDLGRIADGRELQGLMARAAQAIEARGLVLWVAEANGTQLRPSIAHGYSDRVLQRMGTLPAGGDNVTSLAFRTMQPQVLRSSLEGHGALAVPMVTATGCVGVLAAEVQGAKPGDARFAVARMIAAQLSTIVGPSAQPASAPR